MKRASRVVLDSSAVLAMVLGEPSGERLDSLLAELDSGASLQVAIGSVNWCEVLTKLHRNNDSMRAEDLSAALSGVELVPFDRGTAEIAASYIRTSPSLSLGDRACLALASLREAEAWTTDKAWARLKLSVDLEVLR